MLGSTEEDLLALPLTSLLGKPAEEEERFIRVLATQKPDRYESTLRKKDGTLLPVEIFLQSIPDETSGQTCVSVFITDIAGPETADGCTRRREPELPHVL